jgi:hypothetical protein
MRPEPLDEVQLRLETVRKPKARLGVEEQHALALARCFERTGFEGVEQRLQGVAGHGFISVR